MQPSKGIKGIKKHKNANKHINNFFPLRCNQDVTKMQPSKGGHKGHKEAQKRKNVNKCISDFFFSQVFFKCIKTLPFFIFMCVKSFCKKKNGLKRP